MGWHHCINIVKILNFRCRVRTTEISTHVTSKQRSPLWCCITSSSVSHRICLLRIKDSCSIYNIYYKSRTVSRVGHLHLNEGHCPLNVSRLSTSIRQTLEKLCNKLIYLTELKTILNFLQHHYTEVFSW